MEDFLTLTEELLQTTKDAKDLSLEYLDARKTYNHCYNQLIVMIQKAGLHKSKKSPDNKIIELLNDEKYGQEAMLFYEKMLEAEAEYKGLEAVLKAYANHSVALCSLMKQQTAGEMTEAMRNKYSNN